MSRNDKRRPQTTIMIVWILLTVSLSLSLTNAITVEEAGVADFTLVSTGHGPVQWAQTTDNQSFLSIGIANPCYVAKRNLQNGKVDWRRNVCSKAIGKQENKVAWALARDTVASLEGSLLRVWSVATGGMQWEREVASEDGLRVGIVEKEGFEYVVVMRRNKKALAIHLVDTGTLVGLDGTLSADDIRLAGLVDLNEPLQQKVSCEGFKISFQQGMLRGFKGDSEVGTTAERLVTEQDTLKLLKALTCDAEGATFLVSTERGTTCAVLVTTTTVKELWKAHEGLTSISSALLLDASHYVGMDHDPKKDVSPLLLSRRLQSQVQGLTEIVSSTVENLWTSSSDRRAHFFGFVKMAVLLSPVTHRIYGLATTGTERAQIQYAIDLPAQHVRWHRLVHGIPNPQAATRGNTGLTLHRDVMALTASTLSSLEWTCFDGATGMQLGQGSVPIGASVRQVVPIAGDQDCRQGAALILNDGAVVTVPPTASEINTDNRPMFSHSMNRETGQLIALQMTKQGDGKFSTREVGTAVFPGEEIMTVAYPSREQVVQSPCHVLGDDSLLLKYLNPHLAVVMTTPKSEPADTDIAFVQALHKATIKANAAKPKPMGVGETAASSVEEESITLPNLFVNVVDTVTGRVLYRTSHSHASLSHPIKAIVSENWVVYSFVNSKTRRGEVGVLTLVRFSLCDYSLAL